MSGLTEAKHSLAVSTKRGIPLILAGLLYWIVAEVCGLTLSESQIVWVYIVGLGVVFPLGILIAMLFKIDLFAKGNPLGVLAGIVGGMQILFAPIILLLFFKDPNWMPFALGVLNGAHFLPYAWIYNSKSYLVLSVVTTVVAACAGAMFVQTTFTVTPLVIAITFLGCLLGILAESKRDVRVIANATLDA